MVDQPRRPPSADTACILQAIASMSSILQEAASASWDQAAANQTALVNLLNGFEAATATNHAAVIALLSQIKADVEQILALVQPVALNTDLADATHTMQEIPPPTPTAAVPSRPGGT